MHGAGAAESDSASELGASQPKKITQHPEEGHVWIIDCKSIEFPIDGDAHVYHAISSSTH
jgi:hypothetical protein